MPQDEAFWNPYRMVPRREGRIDRKLPLGRHRLCGLSGEIEGTIKALTCLLVGQSKFFRKRRGKFDTVPTIPGTSLKGVIRSMAELIGHGCAPLGTEEDSRCTSSRQLCITCRIFGFLQGGDVHTGLVSFGDAEMIASPISPNAWKEQNGVLLANPKPTHKPFYPPRHRKIYPHQPACKEVPTPAPPGVGNPKMFRKVQPAPADTTFAFQATFENLREEELALLLYAIVLEEGMAHKIGGCKPLGAGSARISIDRLTLTTDPGTRYRRNREDQETTKVWEGEDLTQEIDRRTGSFHSDTSETMQALRRLIRFDPNDPHEFRYPSKGTKKNPGWFDLPANKKKPLKPWNDF